MNGPNVKLKKGAFYCAIIAGRINYGTYMGRAPGYYIFHPSDFASDPGYLGGGIRDEHISDIYFIEIPSDKGDSYLSCCAFVQSCLPE